MPHLIIYILACIGIVIHVQRPAFILRDSTRTQPLFNKTMRLFDYATGSFYFREYGMHS